MINPCNDPRKSGVEISLKLEDIYVPLGDTKLTKNFPGPLDKISSAFGSGSDRCGAINYRITDTAKVPLNLDIFHFEYEIIEDERDALSFTLKSEAFGTDLRSNILLHAFLVDYPGATDRYWEFELHWRECRPFNFKAPDIPNMKVAIGDAA